MKNGGFFTSFYFPPQELMFVKQLNPYEDKSSALPIPFKPVQVKTPFSSMIPEEVIEPRVEESEREEDKYENYRNLGAIDQVRNKLCNPNSDFRSIVSVV